MFLGGKLFDKDGSLLGERMSELVTVEVKLFVETMKFKVCPRNGNEMESRSDHQVEAYGNGRPGF